MNSAQRSAVEAPDGPVLIIAGPGTGKTRTLTTRMAYLLKEKQVEPQAIMALTFTHKAAREMRDRLSSLLGNNTSLPEVTTFHAFAARLLREHRGTVRILSETERQEIIRALPRPFSLKGTRLQELSLRISQVRSMPVVSPDKAMAALVAQYEGVLAAQGVEDFDGLLLGAHAVLSKSQVATYRYLLVDEFQDTSELQYAILRLLAPHGNVFVIGDPNQSIYAFRGAGAAVFDYFMRDYPHARTIALIENYRSSTAIVAAANSIFPDAPQLIAQTTAIGMISAVQTLHEYSEASYILSEIEAVIGGSDFIKATSHTEVGQPKDFAVLYRTHRAAQALQKAFAASGLPYQIAGEGSPYLRPDMQLLTAGLHWLQHSDNFTALLPKAWSEHQLRAALANVTVDAHTSISDLVAEVARALGVDLNDNIRQLQSMLVQFGLGTPGLAAALQHLEEISEQEFYDPSVNAVTLLTIHAAKGLEFPHVFLLACEEGILPKLNSRGEGSIDEERRLFYVAITRAKETLRVLHAKMRGGNPATLSRFAGDMSVTLLPRTSDPHLATAEQRYKKRAAKRAQISLF